MTHFNEEVTIHGDMDTTQLEVRGHTTQTEPLQTWENSAGDVLAQVTTDGRLQIGEVGTETADAMIEAHREDNPLLPERGIHTLGQIGGEIADGVAWAVHELELLGSGGVEGVHSALRAQISQQNSGDATAANVRAGEFTTTNFGGSTTDPVGQATGIQVEVTNAQNAHLAEAVGVQIAMQQEDGGSGAVDTAYGLRVEDIEAGTENYAIQTGKGLVRLGDTVELQRPASVPGTPDTDTLRLYPKSDGKLYAKNWNGDEYSLTDNNGASSTNPVRNDSGAAANQNDIGYLDYDSTHGWVYKTTTTANFANVSNLCVVQTPGANGFTIDVVQRGKATVAYIGTAPVKGNFLVTGTTAGKAQRQLSMRPEVFAVAVSEGTNGLVEVMLLTGTTFVARPPTSRIYRLSNHSNLEFASTISGTPTTTSVVYGSVTTGSEDVIKPGNIELGRLRLHNITRGTYRLIYDVNLSTNVITTEVSADNWAAGDVITVASPTVVNVTPSTFMEIDLSQQSEIPVLTRSLEVGLGKYDTGGGNQFLVAHSYETFHNYKQLLNYNQVANTWSYVFGTIPLVERCFTIRGTASGTSTGIASIFLRGYYLATP